MPMRMSGERLRVVTPVCLTTVGSDGRARLTRFSTSTCAMFTSTLCSKVTLRLYEPSLVHEEDMYIMPSTPLTCCSTGAAIGFGNVLGAGAGVLTRHRHRGRRNLRKLGQGQIKGGNASGQGDEDGQHRGEDRSVDEKA